MAFWPWGQFGWQQELNINCQRHCLHQHAGRACCAAVARDISLTRQRVLSAFYNPDCPCSRFNARHVKSFIREFDDSVSMYIVVPSQQDLAKSTTRVRGQNLLWMRTTPSPMRAGCTQLRKRPSLIHSENYFTGAITIDHATVRQRLPNFAELSLIAFAEQTAIASVWFWWPRRLMAVNGTTQTKRYWVILILKSPMEETNFAEQHERFFAEINQKSDVMRRALACTFSVGLFGILYDTYVIAVLGGGLCFGGLFCDKGIIASI